MDSVVSHTSMHTFDSWNDHHRALGGFRSNELPKDSWSFLKKLATSSTDLLFVLSVLSILPNFQFSNLNLSDTEIQP